MSSGMSGFEQSGRASSSDLQPHTQCAIQDVIVGNNRVCLGYSDICLVLGYRGGVLTDKVLEYQGGVLTGKNPMYRDGVLTSEYPRVPR
ncbi:hypothetical protein F511_45217 [Dorcoceras hygrometricum]|uniref:Uncharacterized protein n=1 Tax=Dorcoceras hygrometricum TaxID=472368 RepID=A0A2Z6ZXT8_9LAMI|nr:hypothetical protein F511_45217 [Dorcoceras hygrometricum]